jgi:hypothetical protein
MNTNQIVFKYDAEEEIDPIVENKCNSHEMFFGGTKGIFAFNVFMPSSVLD